MNRIRKCAAVLFGVTLLAFAVAAHNADSNSLPPGTILPVLLNSTLSSAKATPGQVITGRVMQDVPLRDGRTIHAGTRVVGHITSVTPASNGNPARLSLRFDALKMAGEEIPVTTNLRAIASFMEVDEAQIPVAGPDRGTPEDAWTTVQIGGDTVYRGGGPVESAFGKVGKPVYDGVLDQLNANPDGGCRAAVDSNDAPQALWVFSSNACGTYSLPHLKIVHSGRTNPAGEIVLGSTEGQVSIHAGAGMLLRADSTQSPGA
jgi:hypothetical protein